MRFPGSQVSKYKTIGATILNICCKSFTANYQLFYGSLMNFLGKERQGRTTFDLQWDDRAHAGREIWKMFLWSEEQEKKIQKTNCEEELSRYSCLQTASLEDYWKINVSCSPNKNGRIGVYFHWKITFLTDPEWGGWSVQFYCNILMSVNVPFQNQRHEQRHFQGVLAKRHLQNIWHMGLRVLPHHTDRNFHSHSLLDLQEFVEKSKEKATISPADVNQQNSTELNKKPFRFSV